MSSAPRSRTRSLPRALRVLAVAVLLGSLDPGSAARAQLPAGFQDVVVFSGLDQPTAVAFSPDGRVFVGEKAGRIKVFDDLNDGTPDLFADLRLEVLNHSDRGLLAIALDPDFPATPYVYALYTFDANTSAASNQEHDYPPKWGDQPPQTSDLCPDPPGEDDAPGGCVAAGRLVRLQASGNTTIGAPVALVQDWFQQYSSHSVGDLAFSPDGMLYASGGDGASYVFPDWGQYGSDPPPPYAAEVFPDDPPNEGGAMRSQDAESAGDGTGLSGTLIRVDPATGAGALGNPMASDPDPNRRRIVAYGLRNPFRIEVAAGSGDVYVGDVGWNSWEEVNRIPGPATLRNFGWPCFEGADPMPSFEDLPGCQRLMNTPPGPMKAHDPPHFTYTRAQALAGCGGQGDAAVAGLALYPGGTYPAAWDGALFIAEFARNCIFALRDSNADGVPEQLVPFLQSLTINVVDLELGPDGDLFYVDLDTQSVHRIRYGDNQLPVAVLALLPGSTDTGPSPHTVTFDGSQSTDADGGALLYAWDWGDNDGQFDDSTLEQPVHTYTGSGSFTARLRVTDPEGAASVDTLVITTDNARPTPTITAPSPALRWSSGDLIGYSGAAEDPQEGALPPGSLSWALVLHHCAAPTDCHPHPQFSDVTGAAGSFSAPQHAYPSFLELTLTARDSGGLTSSTSVRLEPQTVALTVTSSPSGLRLLVIGDETLGGAPVPTPFVATVVRNSLVTLTAPGPQALAGVPYVFASWSDGGDQTHLRTFAQDGAVAATYTVPLVFSNGFEEGTTGGWSSVSP